VCDDGSDDFLQRAGRLVGCTLTFRPAGRVGRAIAEHLLGAYVPPLWRAGILSPDVQTQALLRHPGLVRDLDRTGPPTVREQLRDIVGSLIAQAAAAGTIDESTQAVVSAFTRYAGFADFAAAVRWPDRPAGAKNGAWAVHVLQHLAAPDPDDVDRLRTLAGVKPDTLFAAGVFAPVWAAAVERVAPVEGLDGLARFAAWPGRYLGPTPWALDGNGNRVGDWDLGATVAERAGLDEALAAMGQARLRALLKHPLLGKHARISTFCLAAVVGENAAEVEAKFLKRDKWAVVALGMLPEEGDVQDRYLALRRFAQGAKKSGPQRGASEAVAVQLALAHLAVTGGYEDTESLELAVEMQLAADVDPATKRWTVGDYDVWVEPDERATVRIERDGKPLKSVPGAVRGTPEYAEAKEARELLLAQAERVRCRLERAMVNGEVFDRAAYDQLVALPVGRMLLLRHVLRIQMPGADAPIETLDGRTLEGKPLAFEGEVRVQVAHPLHLAGAGTLEGWQRQVVAAGIVQPVNQLFRGVYEPNADERANHVCRRFAGPKARLDALRRALQKAGWETPSYYVGFVRRFAPPAVAELTLEDWVAIGGGNETVTLGELAFHGRGSRDKLPELAPLWFAEAVRDADLAATAAQADRPKGGIVSPEQLAARAALVRAFAPAASVLGEIATVPGGAVHLVTGAAYDVAGNPLLLPDLPLPAAFPYPDPEPTVATVVARALHLVTAGP
jgi:hypothetical protein